MTSRRVAAAPPRCARRGRGQPSRVDLAVRCRVPVALDGQRLLDDDLLDVVAHALDGRGDHRRRRGLRLDRLRCADVQAGLAAVRLDGASRRRPAPCPARPRPEPPVTPRSEVVDASADRSGTRAAGRRRPPVSVRLVAPSPAATAPPTGVAAVALALTPVAPVRLGRRLGRHDHTPAPAVLARRREVLEQPAADPLAGHLHQAERGDLGDLVAGAVAGQALGQPPQHQVAVRLEHHVDEVDHDDAADVAQPQLAHDLLGRFEVVAGDRLLEVAAGAGELAGVDVDDRHRLGAVDHQRAARGQPHLAVERLEQLLVDPVGARRRPAVPTWRCSRSASSGATCAR